MIKFWSKDYWMGKTAGVSFKTQETLARAEKEPLVDSVWLTRKKKEINALRIFKPLNYNPTYIVIHHSLTADGITVNWPAIRRYHLAKGWSDIGYHFGIEYAKDDFYTFVGRPIESQGGHTKDGGFNNKSIRICLVGNFDETGPQDKQIMLASLLVNRIRAELGISNKNVIGHREAQAIGKVPADKRKSCPGRKFDMNNFRRNLPKYDIVKLA